jgi:uncharacterized protein YxeA
MRKLKSKFLKVMKNLQSKFLGHSEIKFSVCQKPKKFFLGYRNLSKTSTTLLTVKKILFMLLAVILISGCSSINKENAEVKAKEFVNEKVKFFTREKNATLNLPAYRIDSITSYQENKNWVVVMHVSAKVGNETKKNDLIVKINKKGEVIEFNGRKVPKQLR